MMMMMSNSVLQSYTKCEVPNSICGAVVTNRCTTTGRMLILCQQASMLFSYKCSAERERKGSGLCSSAN